MVEFRILGSIEVWTGAHPVHLGGPKPRAMLGALLSEHGRSMPVGRLVDAIWGDAPPSTARALVQTYVSQLRHALKPHGAAAAIVTTAVGYRIELPVGALDCEVFTQLVDQGRQAVAERRPSDAVAFFDQALGLWRGAAFGGIDNPYFSSAAAHLEEIRLGATEERVAAAIAADRLDALSAELTLLVGRHPTRERFRAQLMTVLYRLGRRADALAAYRAGRVILRAELGIEPGAVLDATHRAILRDDVEVLGEVRILSNGASESGPVPVRRVSAAPPRPVQLPAVPADFTGREGELAAIITGLTAAAPVPAVPVRVITGAAGTGKTTLATRVAHGLAPMFPDGQLYADLRGSDATPAAPADVLGHLLRALGVEPATLPGAVSERAGWFREQLAGRRVLLVLDDARDDEQLAPLLPGSPSCAVLVTSRYRSVGPAGADRTALGPFAVDTATALLGRLVGVDRLGVEPAAAARIVARCERLPLAVRIAGERLAGEPGWPLAVLAHRLDDEHVRLDVLTLGSRGVRASLSRGYRSLDRTARRALRMLSVLRLPSVPAWVIGSLLDVSAREADGVVERLTDAHLLDFVCQDVAGQLRHGMRDLTRLFAAERCREEDQPADMRAALTRLLARLQTTWASAVRRAATPTGWPAAWCLAERETSALLVVRAAEHGLYGAAECLARVLPPPMSAPVAA